MISLLEILVLLLLSWKAGAIAAENNTANETTCSTTIRGMPFEDVKRSAVAVRLAEWVGDSPTKEEGGTYYESGIDAVYTKRIGDDYCVVAFRGTTAHQPTDWISNLFVQPVPLTDNCDVHEGYYKAYTEFEYLHEIETFMADCQIDCPACEIVLTGHSQGGGIAEIAALLLLLRNDRSVPYVVTFGGVQSLGAGCRALLPIDQTCRWYRYTMARESTLGRKLVYDPIPLLYSQLLSPSSTKKNHHHHLDLEDTYARNGGLAFVGHEILLHATDPSSVYYVGFNAHQQTDLANIDGTGLAHFDTLYTGVIEAQEKLLFYGVGTGNGKSDNDCWDSNATSSTSSTSTKDLTTTTTTTNNNNETDPNCASDNSIASRLLPIHGFGTGSLCNPDEETSVCGEGATCKSSGGWFWDSNWKSTCQENCSAEQRPKTPPPPPEAVSTDTAKLESTTLVDRSSGAFGPTGVSGIASKSLLGFATVTIIFSFY